MRTCKPKYFFLYNCVHSFLFYVNNLNFPKRNWENSLCSFPLSSRTALTHFCHQTVSLVSHCWMWKAIEGLRFTPLNHHFDRIHVLRMKSALTSCYFAEARRKAGVNSVKPCRGSNSAHASQGMHFICTTILLLFSPETLQARSRGKKSLPLWPFEMKTVR